MKQEEINKILENHKHWIRQDCKGWENMKADLHGANLRGANLCDADLREVDLRYANLHGTDFRGADLRGADLRGTDLRRAELFGANLCDADLREADLRYANLHGTDLHGANLRGTDLSEADLCGANLCGANLREAKIDDNIIAYTNQCPQEGSFIGFKKCSNKIVKLKICEDAKRSNATTNKCRCDKAEVLGIYDFEHNLLEDKEVASNFDNNFIYEVGKIVSVDNFDNDRWKECSAGIHFFLTFEMAVIY